MTGAHRLAVMRQALSGLYDGLRQLRAENGGDPVPGSLAAAEFSVPVRQECLFTARSSARFLTESGGEHLLAFIKMVTEPVQPIACWTCIRTLLEACARAAWILDPTVDAEARVRRAFAIQFDELSNEITCARAMGEPENVLRAAREGVDEAARDAVALGCRELRDRRGRRNGIGQRLPSATELVKNCLDEEVAYRILSAVTHGQARTIQQLSYGPAGPAASDSQVGGVEVAGLSKTVNVKYMQWLGLIGAKAFAKPNWFEFAYYGWDSAPLRGLLDGAFDKIGAGPTPRFWAQGQDAAGPARRC